MHSCAAELYFRIKSLWWETIKNNITTLYRKGKQHPELSSVQGSALV